MLRFRNPGTQYSTQVQVIKQLYAALGHQESFSLNDMAVVIAQGRLMTAYGYAGDDAIRLSMTDQESMNSALMNAKMYAEVFRMLGWVTPYGASSYPLVFTYIGIHVALSTGDCSKLYDTISKIIIDGLRRTNPPAEGFSYARNGGGWMSYRKVTYLEQCWYVLRFWLREKIRKDNPHAKKTEASMRVSRMPKSDR